MLTVSAWHKCMYVQVQGQGGWSAPYPTCNQVISLCSFVTLVIKQPVPLWQIYLGSLCRLGRAILCEIRFNQCEVRWNIEKLRKFGKEI